MKTVQYNNGNIAIVTSRHANMLIESDQAVEYVDEVKEEVQELEVKEEKQVIETKEEKKAPTTKGRKPKK